MEDFIGVGLSFNEALLKDCDGGSEDKVGTFVEEVTSCRGSFVVIVPMALVADSDMVGGGGGYALYGGVFGAAGEGLFPGFFGVSGGVVGVLGVLGGESCAEGISCVVFDGLFECFADVGVGDVADEVFVEVAEGLGGDAGVPVDGEGVVLDLLKDGGEVLVGFFGDGLKGFLSSAGDDFHKACCADGGDGACGGAVEGVPAAEVFLEACVVAAIHNEVFGGL